MENLDSSLVSKADFSTAITLTVKIAEQNKNLKIAISALNQLVHAPVIGVTTYLGGNLNRPKLNGIDSDNVDKVKEAINLLNSLLINEYDIKEVVMETMGLNEYDEPTQ